MERTQAMLQDGKSSARKDTERQNVNLMQLAYGHLNPSQLLKLSCSSMALKTMKVILSSSHKKGKELRNQMSCIRIRFVIKAGPKRLKRGGSSDVNGNDDVGEDGEDLFGDFEDLETGQKYENHEIGDARTDDMIRMDDQSADEDEDEVINPDTKSHQGQADGNGYYDKLKEEVELQKQVNLAALNELDEATRIEIEGFRTGTYLRLEVL
ncbi:hypothetical protein HAX54_042494 [Datura stramonium]|uniref:Uncharacterized protein n=1 Tax=Datura stramonium TaxID=4076 RepID=A0ABS8W0X7_DATST|nr:hypothetical protein [Datura stramonium]